MYINNKFHKFFFGSKTFLTDQLSVFNQKMYWMLFLSCIMCLNLSAIHTQYKYVCACIWRGVEVVFRCRSCTIYSHGFYSCWTTCQDRTRWHFLGHQAASPNFTANESPCPQELFSGSSQLCNIYGNKNILELCGSLKAAFNCKTLPFHLL